MPDKMTATEIKATLDQFCGTSTYTRWSLLYPRFVLTDGAKFLADKCGAYWLMDIIGSIQSHPPMRNEAFQVWEMKVDLQTQEAVIICEDGNDRELYIQRLEYTDFPLEKIKLYFAEGGPDGTWVILLPSEY